MRSTPSDLLDIPSSRATDAPAGLDDTPGRHSRRRFLAQGARLVLAAALVAPSRASAAATTSAQRRADLAYLRGLAQGILDDCAVPPNGTLPDGKVNRTGFQLRLPGANLVHYPALWVRDAAMMLGSDFVPAEEIAGWVRFIAAYQAPPEGIRPGRTWIPPFSIPDHIDLECEHFWFPGNREERDRGLYGFMPPADNAFFFLQMVHEHWRLTRSLSFFNARVRTTWGEPTLREVCLGAFASVAVDDANGLVVCEAGEGRTRADWGFCDAIRKTGLCLMPSLLRWQAARQLAEMHRANGEPAEARRLEAAARQIQAALAPTFYQALPDAGGRQVGCLLSATELGRKDDLWAAAFAIWLGALPRPVERAVARHLLAQYESGQSVFEGHVRHLPPEGDWGGHWEVSLVPPEEYQNGGYWGTPTGWFVTAIRKVSPAAADRLLDEYVAHLRAYEAEGAPWEWLDPKLRRRANPRYASSAGLVYVALTRG